MGDTTPYRPPADEPAPWNPTNVPAPRAPSDSGEVMMEDVATPALIVVVDDDRDIARFIEFNLKLEGYEVKVAYDGEAALQVIGDSQPALVILDWMMPKMNGLDVTRKLRADPMTAPLPVILLTARGQTADKVIGLTTGVDDYLVKPFDTMELLARVRSILRRNRENREVSPLTGLPGNNRILREIVDRARAGADYAVGHVDIDRFKSVNDRYGFMRGDEFISALARSLHRGVMAVGLPPAFLGHIGGDDFLFVCGPEQVYPLSSRAVEDFERAADLLYDPEDAARGWIELKTRSGTMQQANLVTLSIGVALSTNRRFTDPREVISVASEMKNDAKKHDGSWVSLDRRGIV